ncbi:hypothetical protein [Thalassotalea profundi]|uniref:Transcription factor zinc-finger domain-containing protein n=1 Tax=Thalassotalea profundi TaxID=2036687 RepID=A0ABQ3IMW8_9GAMM|nr:hypothetical protein [Thalassotalea profundi]GHE86827.1 hypothetical protein GCM10011501_15080 [Thalassotalea profundi]
MIDFSYFSDLSQQKAKAFNQEKNYIKRVLSGKDVNCRQCDKLLNIQFLNDGTQLQLQCKNGCTDIILDLDGPS